MGKDKKYDYDDSTGSESFFGTAYPRSTRPNADYYGYGADVYKGFRIGLGFGLGLLVTAKICDVLKVHI